RRDAPADAPDLRAKGARAAEADAREHAALLGARPRAAAADPGAHDRVRAQPRGRRGRPSAPRRGRAAAGPDRAARAAAPGGDPEGAQALPPRARALRQVEISSAESEIDGLQQADDQGPGGGGRDAGARAPPGQPGDLPRAPAAGAARPGASPDARA